MSGGRAHRFAGTWVLARHQVRRDRLRLPVWVLALVALGYSSAAAAHGLYDTPQTIETYEQTVGDSAAAIVMSGPPVALNTIGGITVFEVRQSAVLGVALMAVFLTVRHTRADEEAGRTELVRAGVLGRQADLLATAIVVGAACLVVGLGLAATFLELGLDPASSALFGLSIAAVGLVATGVSLVAAQVTDSSRSATGIALATTAVLYLVRAAGDVAGNGVSWLSPIGWAQAVQAFGRDRWWPLLLAAAAGALLMLLACWLETRRDFGAGLVAPRPGPARAAPWITTPTGLAARLQRGSVVGWSVGTALLGVLFGSLVGEVGDMVEGNPTMRDFFARSGVSIEDSYFGTVLVILALTATGFTIASVLRLGAEESASRAEPLLATATSRWSWATGTLLVSVAGTVLVLLALGLGVGLTTAWVLADPGRTWSLLGASLAYLPAILVLGSAALALVGWLPHLTSVAWALLAVCFVVGWLADLLSLPAWVVDASPYSHTPQVPMEPMSWTPVLAQAAVALVLGAFGLWGLRRRDLRTG